VPSVGYKSWVSGCGHDQQGSISQQLGNKNAMAVCKPLHSANCWECNCNYLGVQYIANVVVKI